MVKLPVAPPKTITEEFVCTLSEEEQKELVEKGQQYYREGRTYLKRNDYQQAADTLARACEHLVEVYGEKSLKMADYYYNYGCALFELAQMEEDVLGNALSGVPTEDGTLEDSQVEDPDKLTENEKEDVAAKVEEALGDTLVEKKSEDEMEVESEKESAETESEKEETKDTESTEETKDTESTEETKDTESKEETKDTESKKEETKDTESKKEEKEESAAGESSKEESEEMETDSQEKESEEADDQTEEDDEEAGDGEKEVETEDIEPLQLAFEVWDLLRLIYSTEEELKTSETVNYAQVFCKLGSIEMEHERYEEAINLFKQALEVQMKLKENEEEMTRDLACTHYHLFTAYLLSDSYESAEQSINKAIQLIDLRKNKIKETLSIAKQEEKVLREEILELEKLKPELVLKLEDISEMKRSKAAKLAELKALTAQHFASLSGSSKKDEATTSKSETDEISTDKPATIQIRKKRKPEDETTPESAEKKPRTQSLEEAVHEDKQKTEVKETPVKTD